MVAQRRGDPNLADDSVDELQAQEEAELLVVLDGEQNFIVADFLFAFFRVGGSYGLGLQHEVFRVQGLLDLDGGRPIPDRRPTVIVTEPLEGTGDTVNEDEFDLDEYLEASR